MKSLLTTIKLGLFAALFAASTSIFAVTPPTGVGVIPFGTNKNTISNVTLTEDIIAGNTSRVHYYKSSGAITCLSWTLSQTVAGGGRLLFKTDQTPAKSQLFEGVRGKFTASNVTTTMTAGQVSAGRGYTIASTGDTDFTQIGAANSTPGTTFVASGPGTGTGTVTYNEYTSNVIVATVAYDVAPTVHTDVVTTGPATSQSTVAADKWSFISGTSVPTIEVALTYDPRAQTGTCSIRQYLP